MNLEGKLSLALLDNSTARSTLLQERLRTMGHRPAMFCNIGELLSTLSRGTRFDLLLAAPEAMGSESLLTVCWVLGMPAVPITAQGEPGVVALPSYFEDMPLPGTHTSFDLRRISNEALVKHMHTLYTEQDAEASMRQAASDRWTWGQYHFVEGSNIVVHRDREIALQPRQFSFALELFRNLGNVLTRSWLMSSVWKLPPQRAETRSLDACATNVRRKLSLQRDNGFVLRAVYGQGYQLVSIGTSATPYPT
ncbi:winged helix-turn-helix domain-containing protein [Acidovorax cavernicola]|uniref:Winged helix family transcriptional regulator n=1 Tax=Acidovorax cavernicola TaxID=1675792 RepID=A0A9X8CZJ4_9BURK|nr:helix-turn-helix domain-containing protein [Acidovorax cavernicola]RIX74104.1 winged helix family transcriptional regulator [Acidovorax cavernicola]